MYHFTVNIGKEGRQALRQLEFTLDYYSQRDYPKYHLSKLRDCVNLQRLHIGLDHCMIKDLHAVNKNKYHKIDIWDWNGHGEQTLELLCQLPRGLELKIREVNSFQSPDAQISTFFGPIKVIYPDSKSDGVVEKYEAKLKENLGRLEMKRRRAQKRIMGRWMIDRWMMDGFLSRT